MVLGQIVAVYLMVSILFLALSYLFDWLITIPDKEEQEWSPSGARSDEIDSITGEMKQRYLAWKYGNRISGLSENDPELPYRISTHKRCSDPCPELRDKVIDHPDFEFIGFWGPYIETGDDEEKIAEDHNEVETFLDVYFSQQ